MKLSNKKIMSLIVIVCLAASITGCSTLDMMVGLKGGESPDATDLADLSDFEIVDDSIGDEAKEDVEQEAVETITVNAEEEENDRYTGIL